MVPTYFQTDRLLSLIRNSFPDLTWQQHRLLWTGADAVGGDHAMLLLDNGLIFRFPAPDMVDEFRVELAVCEALRSSTDLYVPHYQFVPPDSSFLVGAGRSRDRG